MIRYKVIQTIVGGSLGSEPVPVDWYTGTNEGDALAALVSAAKPKRDVDFGDLPPDMRYRVVGAEITHEVVPDPPDALTWRAEWPLDGSLGLDDCCWYGDTNQYQSWARLDCSGRMAVVSMVGWTGGVEKVLATSPMCEAHVNAYPQD